MFVVHFRIYLSYHTMSQIVCGVGGGCVMAVLWFLLVHLVLTPFFPHICAWLVQGRENKGGREERKGKEGREREIGRGR